ncbi:hypothetical protein ACWGQ5_37465 [Streptomyces sp. NPDC055722]
MTVVLDRCLGRPLLTCDQDCPWPVREPQAHIDQGGWGQLNTGSRAHQCEAEDFEDLWLRPGGQTPSSRGGQQRGLVTHTCPPLACSAEIDTIGRHFSTRGDSCRQADGITEPHTSATAVRYAGPAQGTHAASLPRPPPGSLPAVERGDG